VKLAEGQILGEYRVSGEKGETYYVTTSLRNYNKFADRWELVGADAGTGLQDFGTARRGGSEMHIEQRFSVASGESAIMRIRYYNIEKDRFSWTADRSVHSRLPGPIPALRDKEFAGGPSASEPGCAGRDRGSGQPGRSGTMVAGQRVELLVAARRKERARQVPPVSVTAG